METEGGESRKSKNRLRALCKCQCLIGLYARLVCVIDLRLGKGSKVMGSGDCASNKLGCGWVWEGRYNNEVCIDKYLNVCGGKVQRNINRGCLIKL